MCGIVGAITSFRNGFTSVEADMFETMLFLDTFRGWDSTGVYGVTNDNDVYIAKEACHGPDFLRTSAYKDVRQKMIMRGMFFVGHNRAATRGSVVDKNAHPFWVDDNIILVQNGTMRGDHRKHKDVEVDTEAVAHVLAETPDVEEAINKIDASYALVWYNVKERKLHLLRNQERPLYIGVTAGGGILFASEANTLLYAAAKSDVKWKEKPYLLNEDTLVTYKLTKDKTWIEDVTKITIKPKEVASSNVNFHNWRGNRGTHGGSSYSQGGDCQVVPFARLNRTDSAIMAATREVVQQTNSTASHVGQNDITITFGEEIIRHYPRFYVTQEEAKALNDIYDPSDFFTIEMTDYFAANENQECTVWHIFGQDIHESKNKILFHWIVRDADEIEVLNMCSHTYFEVRASSLTTRHFQKGGEQHAICSSYVLNMKKVFDVDTVTEGTA